MINRKEIKEKLGLLVNHAFVIDHPKRDGQNLPEAVKINNSFSTFKSVSKVDRRTGKFSFTRQPSQFKKERKFNGLLEITGEGRLKAVNSTVDVSFSMEPRFHNKTLIKILVFCWCFMVLITCIEGNWTERTVIILLPIVLVFLYWKALTTYLLKEKDAVEQDLIYFFSKTETKRQDENS